MALVDEGSTKVEGYTINLSIRARRNRYAKIHTQSVRRVDNKEEDSQSTAVPRSRLHIRGVRFARVIVV